MYKVLVNQFFIMQDDINMNLATFHNKDERMRAIASSEHG